MDRFRRNPSPPAAPPPPAPATRSADMSRGKKRPSIGRAAETFHSKLIASFRSVTRRGDDDAGKASPFFAAFFRLPNELHIHILSYLSISDLLALRRTSHALNVLIAACGPALVRFWVRRRLGTLHIKLYPPPGPREADLVYLLGMRRRHIASVRLTRELANFVLRDCGGKHASERQRQVWTSVYEKMIPLVFAVGYFLEEHRRVVLERDLGRIRPRFHIGYDICTTPGIMEEEREIFKRLDQPLRLQYYYMYCFMLQVLARKLRPRAHAGSAEKLVRSRTGHVACDEDIAFVLVLGGISQVAKLLACKTYGQRRRQLHGFITRLSPHESSGWRSHWRDVGVTSPALLDDIPCASIGVTQLDQIWGPLVADMMRADSREFTEHQRERYGEVRASKRYINELMGYDVLRGGRLAGGEDEDSEDEEDGVDEYG